MRQRVAFADAFYSAAFAPPFSSVQKAAHGLYFAGAEDIIAASYKITLPLDVLPHVE